MNHPMWACIREYIAAEVRLGLIRHHTVHADRRIKAYLEAQSTRMETEIRRLIDAQERAMDATLDGAQIYLVSAGWDYEGDEVKAIVATKAEADALVAKYSDRELFSYDKVYATAWKIGEITDQRWKRP